LKASNRREVIADTALLSGLWLVSILIVNPIGNFPLNDDFSYGLTVEHLLETGDYRPLPWFWAPFITNALWGTIFCVPAGFSFTALRVSTLVMGWFAIMGSYYLAVELRGDRYVAVLAAMTLAFNPLFHALSYSFMTDVTFTAISIWAAYFFACSLRTERISVLAIGTALSVAATLSRQIALCVPLAFLITTFMTSRYRPRAIVIASLPGLLCIGSFLSFRWWLRASGREPALIDPKINQIMQTLGSIHSLLTTFPEHLFVASLYLGLFLSPLLLVSIGFPRRRPSMASTVFSVIWFCIVAAGAAIHVGLLNSGIAQPLLMPVGYNILAPTGIGPVMLRDVAILQIDNFPPLPIAFWAAVTVLSVTGAIALIWRLSQYLWSAAHLLFRPNSPIEHTDVLNYFVFLCGLLYLPPIILAGGMFDEYLIPLVAFLAPAAKGSAGRTRCADGSYRAHIDFAAYVLVGALAIFSIGSTRDYLTWNRVRWQALGDVQRELHIDAKEIDGGFEFNALYLYDPRHELNEVSCGVESVRGHSCWWVVRDTFQIGFGPVPGYRVVKEYTYMHWLPPHLQRIVVLRKD